MWDGCWSSIKNGAQAPADRGANQSCRRSILKGTAPAVFCVCIHGTGRTMIKNLKTLSLSGIIQYFDAGLEQRCHESLKEICEKISAAMGQSL